MRRRRSPDSSPEDEFRLKRDRLEKDTVESLIYRIGSKDVVNIEREMGELASLILTDIARNNNKLLKILINCVKNIPERMLLYATMIGLINMKNITFVGQLIELLQRELKEAIRSANFEDAKYIMLFFSVSVNCYTVEPGSVIGLYENFAEVTLDAGRSSQARTDWFAYAILYSLPYSAEMLVKHDASALNDILETVEVYMTKRQKAHVSLLRVWDTDDPHPQEDYLDCIWAQIKHLQTAGWKEKVIWRLYDSFPTLEEYGHFHKLSPLTPPDYDAEVVYPIPKVIFRMFDYTDVIEQEDEDDTQQLLLKGGDQKQSKLKREVAILPGAHTIERFIVDEQLAIFMNNLSFNRVLCAKAMLNLRTRARVALDYMIIEAVFAGMFNLPHPPVRHGNLLFYGSLLIQLCQDASNTMPLVLAQATEVLFERLNYMKPVCISRFIEWFSYHLSNYQLQWSWKEWSDVLSQTSMSPQRRFITETLSRLIRFSYYENVKRLLPKSFHVVLPHQSIVNNKFELNRELPSTRVFFRLLDMIRTRCDHDSVLHLAQRATLSPDRHQSARMDSSDRESDTDTNNSDLSDVERRGGKSPVDIVPLSDPDFDDLEDGGAGQEQEKRLRLKARRRLLRESAVKRKTGKTTDAAAAADDDNMSLDHRDNGVNKTITSELSPGVSNLSIELFFTALLIAGHKTISHTFAFIQKYSPAIRQLTSTVESQVEALHVIQNVWIYSPQMIVIITEHMCRVGLVDPETIVRWAYSPFMTSLTDSSNVFSPTNACPKILDFYVWECLRRTLVRVGRNVTRITSRLESAKEKLEMDRRHSLYSSPKHRRNDNDDDDDENDFDANFKKPANPRKGRLRRQNKRRDLVSGCELISSSSDNEDDDDNDVGDSVGSRVARLEEVRCEAVRSQCAVITLLLHRHARVMAEIASESAGDDLNNSIMSQSSAVVYFDENATSNALSSQAINNIAFWLKGRLVQVILEHFDQLIPYLDNLDEFICGSHPVVQDIFQQLRSLSA